MVYGIPEQNSGTPQPGDGSVFQEYVMPSIDVMLKAFQYWLTAKYGQQTTQQVVANPNSDMAMQYWYLYQMSLQNQQPQQTKNNDWVKYVAIGAVLVAALFTLTQPSKKR